MIVILIVIVIEGKAGIDFGKERRGQLSSIPLGISVPRYLSIFLSFFRS